MSLGENSPSDSSTRHANSVLDQTEDNVPQMRLEMTFHLWSEYGPVSVFTSSCALWEKRSNSGRFEDMGLLLSVKCLSTKRELEGRALRIH